VLISCEEAVGVLPTGGSTPNAELKQIFVEAKYLEEPKNNADHYDAIQYPFDLPLHGDIAIDKP
jgi:hypothetical protein